jgi:hypothetical protein
MKVEPITSAERVHCAYCAKPLQPGDACRKTFYSHSQEAKGRTPEEQLAAYSTNRRIVRVARSYWKKYDDAGREIGREVSRIEVVHMPEPDEWSLWGKFCTNICAMRFGYAAHEAGFRRKS